MDKFKFAEQVELVLHHLMDHLSRKEKMHLLHNIPEIGDIANSPKENQLANLIYQIYAFDFEHIGNVNNPIEQHLVADITQQMDTFRTSLRVAVQLLKQQAAVGVCDYPQTDPKKVFIYSGTRGTHHLTTEETRCRYYVNIKEGSVAVFVEALLAAMKSRFISRTMNFKFKVINPETMKVVDLMRPEIITFFFPEDAEEVEFVEFLSENRHHFNADPPLFMQKVMRGVGFAPHITLEAQYRLKSSTNSFGKTIAHLIARELLIHILNSGIPEPREYRQIGENVYITVYEILFPHFRSTE